MRPTKFALVLCALLGSACSIRGRALRAVADSLANTSEGGAFSRDDDPELVRDALPFALKTMESLSDQLEDHVGLRVALAQGFTSYGFGFVQQPAELGMPVDQAQAELKRAGKLYLRARDYGLEGLFVRHEVILDDLRGPDPRRNAALARMEKEDVPLLYWTMAAWGAAISVNKNDMELVGDVPAIAAMLDRALALDEAYDRGALHEFAISFGNARPGGATPEQLKAHYDRALQLADGRRISPYVTWAQSVLGPAQDKAAYVATLKKAADFDVDQPRARGERLSNILSQRRARYLLAHLDDVFSD